MRTWAVLLSTVLVLSIGFGALEANSARRHGHNVAVTYRSAEKLIGGQSVEFVTAACPRGYKAIAASGDTDGIAYNNGYDLDSTSATAWWINEAGDGSVVRAEVTCLKGRTSAVSASSTESRRRLLEQKREALLEKLR